MRVPFLLGFCGHLYPKLYPVSLTDKRLAIPFTRILAEAAMAGLKLRGSTWYLTFYVSGKKPVVSLETDSLQLAKEKKRQFESSLVELGQNLR